MSQLVGVYGPSGCGKTRFAQETIERASQQGFTCRGVCSPAVFEAGIKTGIAAQLIPGGESRQLAVLANGGDPDVFGKWRMFPETLAWALAYLQDEQPSDLWVVDELGLYEVEQGLGWAALLPRLDALPSHVTLITFRTSLLDHFVRRYPSILAYDLEREGEAAKAALQIDELLLRGGDQRST